jgi:hypothetical protein
MNQQMQAYLNKHRPRVGVRGIYRNPSDPSRDYDFKITRIDGTIAHTINVETGEGNHFIWAFPRHAPKESHLNTLHHWTGKDATQ